MSGSLVVFVNMKGGVGKSTVAVSMAEATATAGKKALLLDLDLQINSSVTLVGNTPRDLVPWVRHHTIEDYLEARWQGHHNAISNYVVRFGSLTHFLPGSPDLALFERRLLAAQPDIWQARLRVESWMNDLLNEARRTFDVVFCDTPPALSMLTEAVIRKADYVVIPQMPDQLSTLGFQRYVKYMRDDLQIPGIALKTALFVNGTAYNGVAKTYRQQIIDGARDNLFPYSVFTSAYSYNVGYKRAMDRTRLDPQTWTFDDLWNGNASEVRAATRELWEKLNLKHVTDHDYESFSDESRRTRHGVGEESAFV